MPTATSTPTPKAAKRPTSVKRLPKSQRIHKRRLKQANRKTAGVPSQA